MKLESYHSNEDKKLWKVVRLDVYEDVPGEIISANDETGECCMQVTGPDGPEAKTLVFPCGIRIVWRKR